MSILALALLGSLAGAALQDAADGEVVDIRRLRFEYRCFFEVDGWKGSAEERFLDRLKAQRSTYEGRTGEALPWDAAKTFQDVLPELHSLMAKALRSRGEAFEKAEDLASASAMAGAILDLGDAGDGVAEAKEWADGIILSYNFQKAKEAVAAGNDTLALELFTLCRGTRDKAARGEVVDGIVGIVRRANNYQTVLDDDDFAAEGGVLATMLDQLKGHLGDALWGTKESFQSIKDILDRKVYIDKSTTTVTAGMLDAAAALAGVRGNKATVDEKAARVVWQPVAGAGGKRVERRGLAARDVLLRGTYDVQVFIAGVAYPVAVFARVTLGDQPVDLRVPNQVPTGMVYVGPYPGGGGFFMDRHEVTVGDVKAIEAGNDALGEVVAESNPDSDLAPAWFFDENVAQAYATATGKSIPTEAQWAQAARGPYQPGERPYPWGTLPPDPATHLVIGGEPDSVGTRPAGASPFGLLDMAGSAAEWVTHRGGLWVVGGHWGTTPSDYEASGGKNRLWDPAPGEMAYEGLSTDEKGEYLQYKSFIEEDPTGVGLRLVVPVSR